ncbi:MAG: hypothetical protein AAF501_21525, partial [Pseudomonadota bacterium]
AYREMLLGTPERSRADRPSKPERKRETAQPRRSVTALSADVRACETRLIKIADMLVKVEERLADPDLYIGPTDRIEALHRKRAEILAAQEKAEALWIAAEEALENAQPQSLPSPHSQTT